jgi:hypothetical protein
VLLFEVVDQLVLAVVLALAEHAGIGFVADVPSLVIVSISDRGETFLTKLAVKRLLTSMSPKMHLKISILGKVAVAVNWVTCLLVVPLQELAEVFLFCFLVLSF